MDGVPYTTAQLRTIIRERHQLAADLNLLRDTLTRRTEALNRLAQERHPLNLP